MRLGLRKFTWPGLIVLLGTVALMAAGCGSAASTTGGPLPDSQQVLRLPIVAGSPDINTLDPAIDTDVYSNSVIEMIFPALLVLDANNNVVPWAATQMPTFDNTANTYTFKLRPNLKWSDGSAIDAGVFAYSINRSENPCTGAQFASYLYQIVDAQAFNAETCAKDGTTVQGKIQTLIGDSITAPDAQTLVIKLKGPAPYFLDAMTFSTLFAQPQQLITQYGNKDWINHLAGFGGNLFKIKLWDHKSHLDVVRNTSFWGTPTKIREIDFTIYQAADPEYAQYLDGKLDQGVAPTAQYKQSKARPDYHEVPWLSEGYFQPNWKAAPFDDVRARQAFDLAINKQILAENVNAGTVTATNHIVPAGMPGYDKTLVGPDGTTSVTGNTTQATALMQAYATAKCGGKIASCPAVTLVDYNAPSEVTADQAVVQMWQTAFPGLTIKTQFIDFNALLKVTEGANPPQIWGIGWGADYPDPQDWLSLQFAPTASNNFGFVVNAQANTLMAEADVNQDPTSRYQEYNQAEQILVTQVAWIPLSQGKVFWNQPTYFHDYAVNSFGYTPMSSWDTMYVSAH